MIYYSKTTPTFKTKYSHLQDNPLHETPSLRLLMGQAAVGEFNQHINYKLLRKKMFSVTQRST